jgi:hypothetical protein
LACARPAEGRRDVGPHVLRACEPPCRPHLNWRERESRNTLVNTSTGLNAQGYNAEAMRDGLIASQGRSYLSLTTYKEEGRWVGKVGEAEAA